MTLSAWDGLHRLGKRTGGIGNQSENGDNPDFNIAEIGQNTEKSPGNTRRLDFSQTSVEYH